MALSSTGPAGFSAATGPATPPQDRRAVVTGTTRRAAYHALVTESDWSEDEYADLLHGERRRFSWVLQRYGAVSAAAADAAAVERYPYEPAEAGPLRGLIFHDEAWHWAMLEIHGHDYVIDHPHLRTPPDEYGAR